MIPTGDATYAFVVVDCGLTFRLALLVPVEATAVAAAFLFKERRDVFR